MIESVNISKTHKSAINGHRDKWSSEIVTQKWLKGLNNNITQTKCYGNRCLSTTV